MTGVKVYRRHNCERRHRSYLTLAKCVWPRAAWIDGEGPFAVVAWCDVLTVTLHADYDAALEAKQIVDYSACGARCTRRHEIVRLKDARLCVGREIMTASRGQLSTPTGGGLTK